MTDRQYRNRIQKIKALEAQMNDLKAQADALRTEIKVAMGDQEQYTTEDGFNIFWRWKKPSETFDTARFKAAQPEMYKRFLKEGKATREFRITKPGKATA